MSNVPAVLIGALAGFVFGSSIVHWLIAVLAVLRDIKEQPAVQPLPVAPLLAVTVANGGFWMAILLVAITVVAIASPPYPWLPWFTGGIYAALALLAALALSVVAEPSKSLLFSLSSSLRKKRVYLTFTVCMGILASVVVGVCINDASTAVLIALVSIPGSYLTGLYIWQFMPPENDADRLHYKPKRRLPK